MNLSVTVVPIEESGTGTSIATLGTPSPVVLSGTFTALKEITVQPFGTIDALTAIVDNIIVGQNTAVEGDGVSWLSAGDIALFNFAGDFTIELLLRHSGYDGVSPLARTLVNKGTTGQGYHLVLLEGSTSNFIRTQLNDVNGLVSHDTAAGTLPDDGLWHHVALVVDRTADTATIYIDGVQSGGVADISIHTSAYSSATPFTVMGHWIGVNQFPGEVDEVRIWSDVRTQPELLGNKDAVVSVTSANLIAYWKMLGDIGTAVTTVQDETTNNNDLTETGTGTLLYTAPGVLTGNLIRKLNGFDVYIFDIFGQQQAVQYQWKWKGV
jgi:hypothetical protein